VTGPDCTVGEKVTCKLTALGRGCVIGSKSKINNCVIMEGVRIGMYIYICYLVYILCMIIIKLSNLHSEHATLYHKLVLSVVALHLLSDSSVQCTLIA
jgi:NDP-sugar pyrophosphorylase family protein